MRPPGFEPATLKHQSPNHSATAAVAPFYRPYLYNIVFHHLD